MLAPTRSGSRDDVGTAGPPGSPRDDLTVLVEVGAGRPGRAVDKRPDEARRGLLGRARGRRRRRRGRVVPDEASARGWYWQVRGDGISGGRLTREKKEGREEDWTERRWRG